MNSKIKRVAEIIAEAILRKKISKVLVGKQIKKSLELKKTHAEKMQQMEEELSGMKLKEQKQEKPEGDAASALMILCIIIAGAILAMIVGNIRRKRKA